MSGKAFIAGSWHAISSGRISVDGTNWKRITRGYVSLDGNVWKSLGAFAPPLSVNVPSQFSEVQPPKPTQQTIAAFVTATPSGGFLPYSYLYEVVSHTGNMPVIANNTSATTSITKVVPASADITDSFKVTVTDSLGSVAIGQFTVEFVNSPIGA